MVLKVNLFFRRLQLFNIYIKYSLLKRNPDSCKQAAICNAFYFILNMCPKLNA